MPRSIHIVGAGLAGLSAAVRLAAQGARVLLYEATSQAGGRCRSYHDLTIGMTIDNGNHLLLSGNHAALAYLDAIGARDRLLGPETASLMPPNLEPAGNKPRMLAAEPCSCPRISPTVGDWLLAICMTAE